MKIKQIRNATIILTYNNTKFLIDPMLGPKGAYPSFPNTHNQESGNPTSDLVVPMEEILDVDACIITHNHLDHFDPVAMEILPKSMKIFTQNEIEFNELKNLGFDNLEILKEEGNNFKGVSLIKTLGKHYSHDYIVDIFKSINTAVDACGIIFKNENEKILYLMGDTIWFDKLKPILQENKPEVIIVNGGDARFLGGERLIMGKKDILEVISILPEAYIVASHMEGVNHLTLSKEDLLKFSKENNFNEKLFIPEPGEVVEF